MSITVFKLNTGTRDFVSVKKLVNIRTILFLNQLGNGSVANPNVSTGL
jgi:hypothetical protein